MSTESKQLDHDIDIPNITSQKAPSKQITPKHFQLWVTSLVSTTFIAAS